MTKTPLKTTTGLWGFLAIVLLAGVCYGAARFHQRGLSRDGLADLGAASATVPLQAERNELQWRQGEVVRHWFGRLGKTPETIYFDQHDVQPFSWGKAFSGKGFVIRFRPGQVNIYDLKRWQGRGYSPRALEGPEALPAAPGAVHP